MMGDQRPLRSVGSARLGSRNTIHHRKNNTRTKHDMCEQVVELARADNWGYTNIGELKKLGIKPLSRNIIKYILLRRSTQTMTHRRHYGNSLTVLKLNSETKLAN